MFNLHRDAGMAHFKLEKLGVRHFYEECDNGYMYIICRHGVFVSRKEGALE
jgi:hypothetical protein